MPCTSAPARAGPARRFPGWRPRLHLEENDVLLPVQERIDRTCPSAFPQRQPHGVGGVKIPAAQRGLDTAPGLCRQHGGERPPQHLRWLQAPPLGRVGAGLNHCKSWPAQGQQRPVGLDGARIWMGSRSQALRLPQTDSVMAASSRGSSTVKVAPWPGLLSTRMRAAQGLDDLPGDVEPQPQAAVVPLGHGPLELPKMRARSSGSMPMPSSRTTSRAALRRRLHARSGWAGPRRT